MSTVIVAQTNILTDKVRLIATNLPYTGSVLILIWRDSDGNYWTGSGWSVTPTYVAGSVHKGMGCFGYALAPSALTNMDGDVLHWVMSDSATEATTTVIAQSGSAKVLNGEFLVRTTWTDILATKLDNMTGGLTAAQIADAVWDELRSGHTAAGSYGESIQDVLGSALDIANEVWDAMSTSHVAVGTLGRFLRDIVWAEYNRRKVDTVAKTETIYQDDNSTPYKVLNLKDSAGNPASENVFEKVPV